MAPPTGTTTSSGTGGETVVDSNHPLHLHACDTPALAAYYSICEPSTFEEASLDPKWIEAMKSEILALEESNTWSVVDLPPGKDSIGCKWVF
ncbi:uncharacterized mitochondrial protein AtMg00820-like [Capsicum annuum]|uniref:uncharacterized mitochondrial protein AtMg00820-like n=1 Tax=Capsicum annuum TaxID=4072 RepID=UPI001FB15CDB|nr:uncharacterized mitochondrial protein AtMg00820-like [Capsicum annuum]